MSELISFLSGLPAGKLLSNVIGILTIASIFIEITPIRINPITNFLRWVGHKMNATQEKQISDLQNRIDEKQRENEKQFAAISVQIDDIVKREEEKDAKDSRNRILRFGDEICRGEGHTQESFTRCLEDIDEYEGYCRDHPDFPNNKTVMTIQRIKEEFAKCLRENIFL